jgi:aspartate dehydrogenase
LAWDCEEQNVKVGIAGVGAIGGRVARGLDEGIEGLALVAVSGRDPEKTKGVVAKLRKPVDVVSPEELAKRCDIVVECAPTAAFESIAVPVLKAGKVLVTVSAAAILRHPEVIDLAKANRARIILATGALLGLDAVRAAAETEIHSVTMVTRKPPKTLAGSPHIVANNIDLDGVKEPLKVFDGSARDGAKGFPANVNVAAALGLAGIGPDRTQLQIWADPTVTRNTHTIKVDADAARFEMTIENVPSVEKPATGKITALSVIAALKGLVQPFKVGS